MFSRRAASGSSGSITSATLARASPLRSMATSTPARDTRIRGRQRSTSGTRRRGRQAVVAETPLAAVPPGLPVDGSFHFRVAGKAAERRSRRRIELVQRVKAHPEVGHLPAPVELSDRDLLPAARLDLDREPVVLPAVHLGEQIRAVRGFESRRGAPEVERDARVGVPQPVLQQRLPAVLEQVRRPLPLPPGPARPAGPRGIGHQRPQPVVEVAGEPEDEALELFVQEVLVDQLAELLMLDAVRRPGAHRAAAEEHRDPGASAGRRGQVEVAALERELEAVDPQPPAPDVAGRLRLGFAQLVVQGRGAEARFVVGGPRGAAGGQDRRGGQEGGEAPRDPRASEGTPTHAPHHARSPSRRQGRARWPTKRQGLTPRRASPPGGAEGGI